MGSHVEEVWERLFSMRLGSDRKVRTNSVRWHHNALIEAGHQPGFVLLAVDHGGHCLGVAAVAAAFDLFDEAGQVLRFLRQLAARPLQELELFHLTTVFPLKAQWVKVEAMAYRLTDLRAH